MASHRAESVEPAIREAFGAALADDDQATTPPVSLERGAAMSRADLLACFRLVEQTQAAHYRACSDGWSARQKKSEMADPAMWFLVLRDQGAASAPIGAFLSFMLTTHEDSDGSFDVVYCYELHLHESLRRRGIAIRLMSIMESIGRAAGKTRAMLTVYAANRPAISLYTKLGYFKHDEEPVNPKRLRSGTKNDRPSFLILAKDLHAATTTTAEPA